MENSSNEMAEQFYQYVEEYLETGEYIYAKRAFHNWLRYQPRPSCEKYEKAITAILLGEVGAKEEKDVVHATCLMSKCGLYRELQKSPYVSQEIKQRYQILAKLQEKYQGATLVNQVRENYRWRSNTIGVLGIVVMVALYVFLAILIARGVLANKEFFKKEEGADWYVGYKIWFGILIAIGTLALGVLAFIGQVILWKDDVADYLGWILGPIVCVGIFLGGFFPLRHFLTAGATSTIVVFIILHSIPWTVAIVLWSVFYHWGYSLIPKYEYRVVFQNKNVLIDRIRTTVEFLYEEYTKIDEWNKISFGGKDLWTDFEYRAMKGYCYSQDNRMNEGLELYFISPKTTMGVAQKAFRDCIYFQCSMEHWNGDD